MMKQNFDHNFYKSIKYIHEVRIFNEIQNNKKIILFDLRKKEEFDNCHLDLAINIPYDEHDEEFFETLNESKFNKLYNEYTNCDEIKIRLKNYKRYFIGLIISHVKIKKKVIEDLELCEIDERERIVKSLILYKSLMSNHVREIGLYNSGMEHFYDNYYFLVSSLNQGPLINDIGAFPSDVLDHRLYVGNQRDATSEDVIKYLKITHIINITQHMKNKFEDNGIKYLNILIEDTAEFKISPFFKTAFDFIEKAITCTSSSSICISASSTTDNLICANLDEYNEQDINQLTEKIKDVEIQQNAPMLYPMALQSLGITSIDSWREAFDKTTDIIKKNKIIQLVYKNFIRPYQSSHARILIHCSMGVSRSPSIAMMYLMKKFKISFDDAYSLVMLHREKSAPIDSFLDELRELENDGYQFCNEDV